MPLITQNYNDGTPLTLTFKKHHRYSIVIQINDDRHMIDGRFIIRCSERDVVDPDDTKYKLLHNIFSGNEKECFGFYEDLCNKLKSDGHEVHEIDVPMNVVIRRAVINYNKADLAYFNSERYTRSLDVRVETDIVMNGWRRIMERFTKN